MKNLDTIPMMLNRQGVYVIDRKAYVKMASSKTDDDAMNSDELDELLFTNTYNNKYERQKKAGSGIHINTFEGIMKLFRVHTVESVAADILKERVKRRYYTQ